MNPKFFITFSICDNVIWGIGRTSIISESDCNINLDRWKRHYKNNYRNAKINTIECSKKLYDTIMQYGSYDSKWKIADGLAELIK